MSIPVIMCGVHCLCPGVQMSSPQCTPGAVAQCTPGARSVVHLCRHAEDNGGRAP